MTREAREVAMAFLNRRTDEELDDLWTAAKGESPAKALSMWLGALEFVMPKLGRTEVSGPDGGPVQARVEVVMVRPAETDAAR